MLYSQKPKQKGNPTGGVGVRTLTLFMLPMNLE